MKAKYNDIRDRLQKHIEDRNGAGTYDLRGSILEADILYFVEKEVNNVVLDDVKKCAFDCENPVFEKGASYCKMHMEIDGWS